MIKLRIPIFNNNLYIKVKKKIKDYDAYVYLENDEIYSVFRNNIDDSIIVHESVHIVNFIFHLNNIKPDIDNDETQAYLTQYIYKELKQVLNGKYKYSVI